jgi:aspartokinase
LNRKGIPAKLADTRELIITDSNFGDAQPLEAVSKKNVIQIFNENKDSVLVITGFIGSNAKHETTTLGRNGSNYTASLVATSMLKSCKTLPMLTESILLIQNWY